MPEFMLGGSTALDPKVKCRIAEYKNLYLGWGRWSDPDGDPRSGSRVGHSAVEEDSFGLLAREVPLDLWVFWTGITNTVVVFMLSYQ